MTGHRIVVLDDEPSITDSLKQGLTDGGFEVDAFNDVEDALKNYRPGAYDLAILDVRMPKMNGFELFRELRSMDPRIKVFFLTAYDIPLAEFRTMFPEIDVSWLLRKPIGGSDLVAKINRALALE